eukprot:TRINITY_DN2361_c0_g2_i2.p1 TRINITY_DN2361_c0_g2~~TRINITY_DN2361_c0_g2_i2.p1  ORF type:complete len:158 (-),score=34.19 TRINITY_DN2361_c0_g2_i2:566-1039(-)
MMDDGGGWTAFWSGKNGKANVFARFDTSALSCSDSATSCLRRLPSGVTTGSWIMAICGPTAIKFQLNAGALSYFASGTRNGQWQGPLVGTTVRGTPGFALNNLYIWTGDSGTNYGWIVSQSQLAASTFASSYDSNTSWDYCNGVNTVGQFQQLLYRN